MNGFGVIGAAAMLGLGMSSSARGYDFASNVHEPRPDQQYTDSGKPLSKRAKRRARGKGKQP